MTGVVANHPCLQSNGIPKGCQGRQRTAAVHFTLYNPLGILLFRDTFSVENSDLTKMCPHRTTVSFSVILR